MIRSTPCVAGCDGPMFSVILSPCNSDSSNTAAVSRHASAASAARPAESLISISLVSAMLFFGFDRPRPEVFAVRFLDLLTSFQPRVHVQRIRFGNADTRFARERVLSAGNGNEWSSGQGRRLGEGNFRQVRRFSGQRKVFAQGKVRVAVPHEDAAQIRMPAKADAHHVVDLALVPIGGFPNTGDRWRFRFLLRYVRLQAHIAKMPVAIEVIDES